MPMTNPPPDAIAGMSLSEIARLAADGRLPPVETWHPAHCGDSGMRIAADGTWYHEGSPIGRAALVRLFSTILRREADGGHVLVTPVEKLSIAVEDAPFVAIEMESEGEGAGRRLAFRTHVGDLVIAGPAHRLVIEDRGHGLHPYLTVRGGLEALVARPVYYELANLALDEPAGPDGQTGLWSDGAFFAFGGPEADTVEPGAAQT
ncbi:DUF1285 domain-containing protein [Sphingomonas abietis]|uniref:DUF1285 domain-containing protein n=1 Tax=Sphingomonas abietis TaxID=3012344 RepID=A0ABY7NP08_9SPHN|nr:DUF1285 domain-containing protein [Sphingomonas abietis]WBO22201.1 DUF1285 domain-containing protein [Sphingomonas abietis]